MEPIARILKDVDHLYYDRARRQRSISWSDAVIGIMTDGCGRMSRDARGDRPGKMCYDDLRRTGRRPERGAGSVQPELRGEWNAVK